MAGRKRSHRVPLDYGNTPQNRLSSYRMSMLAHGFIADDRSGRAEYKPDDSGPMTYSVVRIRNAGAAPVVAALLILVAIVVAVLVFG